MVPMNKDKKKSVPEPVRLACQAIVDKKGENFVALSVQGICSITDYFIIAEGSVPRHVAGIAQHVIDVLKEKGIRPTRVEGMQEGDWVVLDYVDFIVHIFTQELREYYALEEVWKEGGVLSVSVNYGRQ